jgi:hypothetical protein
MPADYDPTTEITHRDSGLWRRVLAASGVDNPLTGAPFTEAMLAGLGGGIGFMIFTFEYKDVTTASVVTRFHPGPFVDNMLERCGAGVAIQQTGSPTLAHARLDAALATGVPVVVRVVRTELPWVAADPLVDMDSADVVVVGRDEAGYLVDDGGGRVERIAADDLARARGRRKADKHWQAHVAGSGSPLTLDVVRGAIRETAEALLAESAPAGVPAGYAKNFGIRGMAWWAERLRDTKSRDGWPRIFADPRRAATGLAMLHALLTGTSYSGPGALRPLYAQFLREVPEVPGATEAAALYQQLGVRWDAVAELVPAQAGTDFAALADSLEAIVGLETSAAKTLLRPREAADKG